MRYVLDASRAIREALHVENTKQVAMENYTLGHLREEDVQMFTLRIGHAITSGTRSLLGARPAANTTLPFRGIGATKGSYVPKKAK